MMFKTVVALTLASSASGFAPSPMSVAPRTALSMGLKVGETFPAEALKKWKLSGKTSVVYFYGADDAPSCKKENSLFDEKVAEFKAAGATVVGVRNEAGAKGADVSQSLVVDEDDAIRNKISISKDLFGLLGGRETYVLNKKGEVEFVFNNQFKPEDHVTKTLSKVQEMKESAPAGFDLASFFAQK